MKIERKSPQTVRREGPLAARPRIGSQPKEGAPLACPKCGATYLRGRWTWATPPAGTMRRKCPACRRIDDRDPGGIVTLAGPYVAEHRDEVRAVLRACEARQKAEHPLERIMAIGPAPEGGMQATTTEPHLARALAHALHGAFGGEIESAEGEEPWRYCWRR